MKREAKEAVKQALFAAGYWEAHGTGKGWFRTIETNGPPGLTSAEQEINRKGGVSYGRDTISILKSEINEIRWYIKDGYGEGWMANWVEDAEKALEPAEEFR